MDAAIFLDTNIWCHYKPIAEIDWRELVGEASVLILVAPVVIDELDKLKDNAASRRVQNRARSTLKVLERWTSGSNTKICEGVAGRLIDDRPNVEAYRGLDLTRGDDELLATVLAYREVNANQRVVLITGDTAPRIKARRFQIETMSPPEAALLSEPDPLEAENKRLKRDVENLAKRLPALRIQFVGSAAESTIQRTQLSQPSELKEKFVASRMLEAASRVPEKFPVRSHPSTIERTDKKGRKIIDLDLLSSLPDDWIPGDEYSRYERERSAYLKSIRSIAETDWESKSKVEDQCGYPLSS